MNRQTLINQVKEEYARLASQTSEQNKIQSTNKLSPEAYYENLLAFVIAEIEKGTFDNFQSGKEIVRRVAADKSFVLIQT